MRFRAKGFGEEENAREHEGSRRWRWQTGREGKAWWRVGRRRRGVGKVGFIAVIFLIWGMGWRMELEELVFGAGVYLRMVVWELRMSDV